MNKEEAQILHGLYYHREIVGEELPYSAAELNWLVITPIPKGRSWAGEDGKLKSIETETDDYLSSIGATSAAAARPLAYLQASGYITYRKDSGFFRVAVTGSGADLARELDTFWGRANILYKKHKDGVLWLLATVLVSLITTLITKNVS
jgi:hypothetical protein